MTRMNFSFTQVATGDLDIAIVGQLPAANLPLGNEFEPGPVQVETFEAPFRRGSLWKQDLEHAPGNTHNSLIFADADADAELEEEALWVPAGVRRKTKEHGPPPR